MSARQARSSTPRKRRTKKEMERARQKARAARKYHLKSMHRMTPEQYESIKEFQGGVCPLCQRANGRTRELAVDHRHNLCSPQEHPATNSCERCWRGLLCGPCNNTLAHSRDSIEFFERAIGYLKYPPAQKWREHVE